jgi:uncharacterized membrane protein
MQKSQKIALSILFVFIVVGFFDAGYLYYKYLTADTINCFIFDGCNTVSASPLSKPFGIPLSLFGLIFYFGMLVISVFYVRTKNSLLFKLMLLGSSMSFLASLYFTYLQGFVIQAFCTYCLISALSTLMILCALLYLRGNQLIPQVSSQPIV